MKKLRLGKKPASADRRDLMMSKYLDLSKFPAIPAEFGHEALIPTWNMLGNDNYGDCVWAGAAHETMLWTALGDPATATFDDNAVLSDYGAVTGFKTSEPASDQGSDMHQSMSYRRHTGILDTTGKRHKIACYVWLEPGNVQELLICTYLFGAVGVGIRFPNSAQAQFDSGTPWTVAGGAQIEGGHYIPCVSKRGANFNCVTWGRLQPFTPKFYETYNDESAAMLSLEFLHGRRSPEGFDLLTLIHDLEMLIK